MSKTITSGGVTFMDLTDSRKLETYITSNLPIAQIFDQNVGTYNPDWSVTNLQLSADVYLDAKEVTTNTNTKITWYKKVGTQSKMQIGTGTSLTINSNQLTGNIGLITYICEVIYQDTSTNPPTAHSEITFTRVDTGINGSNGKDGTSVTILGSYNTLEELKLAHPIGNAGDAYIVDGDLYVWAIDDSQWENVGNIQGPKGEDGKNAKSIILSGDSQIFKVDKSNNISPSLITVTAQSFNTTATNWTYSINGGKTFLSTVPTGVSRNGDIVTIIGSTITSNSIVIKASDGEIEDVFTVYKVTDGLDGVKGNDGVPAPIAFLTNENITFSANAQGQITTTAITSNVVAYNGTTKVTPTVGTITGVPTGMTITPSAIAVNNEIMLTITVANNSTFGSNSSNMGTINIPITYPVSTVLSLTWSKVNTGVSGVGIRSTTVTYGMSDSASTKPDDSEWQPNIPIVEEGKYLWTRTIIDYTDDDVDDTVTYTYVKQGTKGDTGSIGASVTVSSIQYQEGASATIPPTDTWSNSVVEVSDGKFLWTKTDFSDGQTAYGVTKQGISGITFQIYAPNGYLLTNELQSLVLQTFAYEGSIEIISDATFQWSQLIDDVWTEISDATQNTLIITKADVLKTKSYRCIMTYKGQIYTSTATVQDKTDIYNSIMCISSNTINNNCYWVLYTLVYNDAEEVDPLLGPISINAPESPVSGDYWYAVDSTNTTVTLKKYDGTSWVNSTDTQSLSYYWDMINDGSAQIPLGDSTKVKVVSCHDFTSTATLVCEVSNLEDGLLTQSSLSLTDASDPIVSDTEPIATVNGQIWIKPNDNGTYLMLIWDESSSSWISSDMDTRSKVYTSRPSSYNAGDLWITASDTDHGSYLQGTLLQAQVYNTTYNADDWSPTLRYDKDLDNMKETLNNLSQYVTITSSGLRIAARDSGGNLSPFTSLFTSTALTFYQGSDKLLTLANNQLIAPKIVVEDELEVQGEIKLGDLKLIIENNGSFSFAVQK